MSLLLTRHGCNSIIFASCVVHERIVHLNHQNVVLCLVFVTREVRIVYVPERNTHVRLCVACDVLRVPVALSVSEGPFGTNRGNARRASSPRRLSRQVPRVTRRLLQGCCPVASRTLSRRQARSLRLPFLTQINRKVCWWWSFLRFRMLTTPKQNEPRHHRQCIFRETR